MSDGLLGDLPATGGRPDFGTTEVAEPECADCGTTDDLRYYPAEDEHACPPCSNGKLEPRIPWDDADSSPIDDVRRARDEMRQRPVDGRRELFVPGNGKIVPSPVVPKEKLNPMTDKDRALVEKYRGPRDKSAEMAKAYGMSDTKYGRSRDMTATEVMLQQEEASLRFFRQRERFVAGGLFPFMPTP